jgi:hypothetical protein
MDDVGLPSSVLTFESELLARILASIVLEAKLKCLFEVEYWTMWLRGTELIRPNNVKCEGTDVVR